MPASGDVQFTSAGILVITAMLGALTATITLLFRMLMKSKDDHYAAVFSTMTARNEALQRERELAYEELKKNRDALHSMTVSAVTNFKEAARMYAAEKGIQVPKALAPVVPESNSPPTQKQSQDAYMATLGADLTASALVFNLSARPKPETGPELAPPVVEPSPVAHSPPHPDDAGVRAAAGAIHAIRENTEANRENTEAIKESKESAQRESGP